MPHFDYNKANAQVDNVDFINIPKLGEGTLQGLFKGFGDEEKWTKEREWEGKIIYPKKYIDIYLETSDGKLCKLQGTVMVEKAFNEARPNENDLIELKREKVEEVNEQTGESKEYTKIVCEILQPAEEEVNIDDLMPTPEA